MFRGGRTMAIIEKMSQCSICKHYLKDSKCKAFVDGIPEDIINAKIDHNNPIKGQDNNIVFDIIE